MISNRTERIPIMTTTLIVVCIALLSSLIIYREYRKANERADELDREFDNSNGEEDDESYL